MAHITLIDLKREITVPILAPAFNMGVIDFYMGRPNK